ncbi:MAG: GMC family oxidoreductase [Alphaproteobacteria bacterium]|nr:GMC family oxidoreductase [Alphaproteobacteria bacterium]
MLGELLDGAPRDVDLYAEAVVVGSGAGGATCARWLAAGGRRVVVVEEGPPPTPGRDTLDALSRLYRDAGASTTLSREPMPLLQGRCVGGTTVVNGAIQVPLPRDVWAGWPEPFQRLAPWERLEAARARMEEELSVRPTPSALWGGGALMGRALADARPIHRNAPGCVGHGRCYMGCPEGGKASADRALLPRAMDDGALVVARCRVAQVRITGGRARGVLGRFESGARLRVEAPLVVLAAGAVHTPWLLRRSGVRGQGRGFMAHPGAGVAGLFPEPLPQGGTQTWEYLAERARGWKLETMQSVGAFKAVKVPGVGARLAERLARLDAVAMWGVACRAEATGRVWPGPVVRYSPTRRDRQVLLEGVSRAAEAMLEAGAVEVWPGVHGAPAVITTRDEARALATVAPERGVVPMVATHLFGGTRVGPRFEVAGIRGLVAADASIFPSNTGVNPMNSITAMATVVAEAWS